MARPTTTDEITERHVEVARMEFDKFALHPGLLKAYAALLAEADKLGGNATKSWGNTVTVSIAKTDKELEDQLAADQRRWDSAQALWERAVRAEEDDDLREWERTTVTEFAEAEGRPNPFDAFAANDPEIAQLRRDLGLSA